MFVCNIKLDNKKVVRVLLIIIILIVTIFIGIAIYKILHASFIVKDNVEPSDVQVIQGNSYTNILKSVHEDLSSYVGKRISFSGYIYRLSDFKDTEFVLARDMIIGSDKQALIVGFLCNSNKAKDFEESSWVEITRGDC